VKDYPTTRQSASSIIPELSAHAMCIRARRTGRLRLEPAFAEDWRKAHLQPGGRGRVNLDTVIAKTWRVEDWRSDSAERSNLLTARDAPTSV